MLSLLWVGVENLFHRAHTGAQGLVQLGLQPWYWRLGYALWLESLRGPAHWAGRADAPQQGWEEADFVYGETPIVTAYRQLLLAQFPRGGRLLEVGCGRGCLSLVAALAFGAKQVVGFEILPARASKAAWLVEALALKERIQIQSGDATAQSLPEVDLIYLTPTTWGQQNWKRLTQWLSTAPEGCRAVSLTQPLPECQWEILQKLELPYSWGNSVTYFQRKLRS